MPAGNRKLRVVIDTNVFISGLNFAGKPGEVLDLLIKEEIDVLVSPFILSELGSILRKKFGWEDKQVIKVLELIKAKAIEVQPKHRVSVIKEKDADNRILECAVEGEADYIISGDKRHILPLREYSGIQILSPDEFLRFWEARISE
jgi:putative PIN family toxin of toxin-antitoxin system